MAKGGPKAEKRHVDSVQNATLIARIAIGEVGDDPSKAPNRAEGDGGAARSERLTEQERAEIAKLAAESRWSEK
jgi:hypothetical protein